MRTGIAIGSNIGDRLACLRQARARVLALSGVTSPVLSAPIFESAPVDCDPGTPEFLNTVIELEYDEHPVTLLPTALHRGRDGPSLEASAQCVAPD